MREHIATRIDASLHFSFDGCSVDEIPMRVLVVPLAVTDIATPAESDPNAELTSQDILTGEEVHDPLPAYACVAMHSGWERHVKSSRYRNARSDETKHFPGFHLEAAQMLMERDVSGPAVDTMFKDRGNSVDFAVHYALLPRGRWHWKVWPSSRMCRRPAPPLL